MALDLLTAVVLALVGTRLAVAARYAVREGPRRRAAQVVMGLRVRHFALALPVLAAVVATAIVLLQVPGLSFGWWTAIGGVGNPVIGTSQRAGGAAGWIVPALFLAMLVPALPLLVEREERIFRVGSERRSRAGRVRRGVFFGMVHALVGIPIAAALALSVGGWYLTWAYLRGWRAGGPEAGLLESTRAHLAYNLIIVATVVLALVGGGQ